MENQTCVSKYLSPNTKIYIFFFHFKGIDECTEPNIDGTYTYPCNDGYQCIDTNGNFTCICSPVFNISGTCTCMYYLQ